MKLGILKDFGGKILLLALSTLLSLTVAEALLTPYFPLLPRGGIEYRLPHPDFGWTLKPGAKYINEVDGEYVQVEYNSLGWRDTEHDYKKRDDVYRILVLGDSYMESYSVNLEDAFHKRLEEYARMKGKNVEVINLGVGGYGTLQEYLVYMKFGRLYKPDLVLLAFYAGNDLTNNSFEIVRETLKYRRQPYLNPDDSVGWKIEKVDFEILKNKYFSAVKKKKKNVNILKEKSALVRAIAFAIKKIKAKMSQTSLFVKKKLQGVDERKRHLALFGVSYCEEPPEYRHAWEITGRILKRLKKEVEASGSSLMVFSVPARRDVDKKAMEAINREFERLDEKLCFEEAPQYKRLEAILSDLRIEYFDLLPEFIHADRNEGKTLFGRQDRHWNKEGHRLAAGAIMSALEQKGLVAD